MDKPPCIDNAECASGVGEGWWPLIAGAEEVLNAIAPGWTSQQVKEKFGGLRFYVGFPPATELLDQRDGESDEEYADWCERWSESLRAYVRMIEAASYHICESCGKPGKLRTGGWMHTLCDEHEAQYQEEKTMRNMLSTSKS